MATKPQPSKWAVKRFGALASELMERIPTALAAAVERQLEAHHAARLRTLHAYGGAWPAPYEELAEHLGNLDGAQVARPTGASFRLVVVNNVLLVPFRYAEDLTTELTDPKVGQQLNKTCRLLLRRFGPPPKHEQPTLNDSWFREEDAYADADSDLLGDVHPDTIVVIFYVSNADAGLLEVGWGEAELSLGGSLHWHHTELLSLPAPPLRLQKPLSDVELPHNEESITRSRPRFDEAPLPSPWLSPRTAAEKANTSRSPDHQSSNQVTRNAHS